MGEQPTVRNQLKETVFTSKEKEVFRIPALFYDRNKTLLAFAEQRDSAADSSSVAVVMMTGTLTRDETSRAVTDIQWSGPTEVVAKAKFKDKLEGHRPMNPCPVYDEKHKTLFLFFICVEGTINERWQIKNNNNKARLCYVTTTDVGHTWSDVTDLTESLDEMKAWTTFAVGPGHGLQTELNRLIVPVYAYTHLEHCPCPVSRSCSRSWPFSWLCSCLWPCSRVCSCPPPCACSFLCPCPFLCFCSCSSCMWSCSDPHALSLYSDDFGETWRVGSALETVSVECQMAEFLDEHGKSFIYCNARNQGGFRVEAVSDDDGVLFHELKPAKKLVETGDGCQGSVVSFPAQEKEGLKPKWLLFIHPTHQLQREDLGVYVNKTPNDPEAWSEPWVASRGPSGYSDLVYLGDGWFACLFECGEQHITEQIDLMCFSYNDIKPAK